MMPLSAGQCTGFSTPVPEPSTPLNRGKWRPTLMPRQAPRPAERRPSRTNLATALAGQGIVVPNQAVIQDYLASHRDLAKILPSICAQARREFGQDAELILEVYCDPEIDDRHLSLYVRLPAYENNTISERLDRVTQPFEDELCSASGYLLVTTDFRPSGTKHGV
jgi:hypothetical protein